MEKFRDAVHTGEGVTQTRDDVLTNKDKEELRKLEKEILGEAPPTRTTDDELAEIEEEIMQRQKQRDKQAEKDAAEEKPEPELE
jgi:hypothetical protein